MLVLGIFVVGLIVSPQSLQQQFEIEKGEEKPGIQENEGLLEKPSQKFENLEPGEEPLEPITLEEAAVAVDDNQPLDTGIINEQINVTVQGNGTLLVFEGYTIDVMAYDDAELVKIKFTIINNDLADFSPYVKVSLYDKDLTLEVAEELSLGTSIGLNESIMFEEDLTMMFQDIDTLKTLGLGVYNSPSFDSPLVKASTSFNVICGQEVEFCRR